MADKVQAAVKAFMGGNTEAIAKAVDALNPTEAKECIKQFAVHLTEVNKTIQEMLKEHDEGCFMLAKYAEVARDNGVKSFQFGHLGIELQPLQPPKARRKAPRPKRRRQ